MSDFGDDDPIGNGGYVSDRIYRTPLQQTSF